MKKQTSLILVAIAVCCVCRAQPVRGAGDSAASVDSAQVAGNHLFLGFTAVLKGPDKVSLKWDADSAREGDYFVMQRGPDGVHYETIGALRSFGSSNHYEMTDQSPPNGVDFYRIKYQGQTGLSRYSRAVELNLSGDVDFKFYPNPVDKLFIVRTAHSVDIQVLDPAGVLRLSKRLQPGIEVIDASSLEHGVYIIRVTDKESNRSISAQLVKN
jgi:type IX secretion system substrate protein